MEPVIEEKKKLKAEELRIGNLVLWKEQEILEITGIKPHVDDYMLTTDTGWRYLKNCSPIPLTEDWLLRMGFEKEDKQRYTVYRKHLFTYNQIQAAWWYNGQVLVIQPEYVHQLQNLYYALTSQELTIKE
jgi:hypothetical protein